ncbi:MAG: hypothetical protein K2K31_03195, partial [Clostridia bacterium]|nr:hypothetical protein [Clostridia bacterium]
TIIILTTLICLFGAFFFTTTLSKTALAETEVSSHEAQASKTISSDNYFAVTLSAIGRSGQTLQISDPVSGYYCLNWREVSYLEFKLENKLPINSYITFELKQIFFQTDDLNMSIGNGEESQCLTGMLSNNTITYRYYTDKTVVVPDEETENNDKLRMGRDFGLYQFDFVYSYFRFENNTEEDADTEDNIQQENATPVVSDKTLTISVAILPDDITKIEIPNNITISYDVSSSDKFLNIYRLYVSNVSGDRLSIFDYVNPECLQWNVTGTDTNNLKYVLCQETKNIDDEFLTYRIVWDSLERSKFTGSSFVFDSNNIEGDWTATLKIVDKNGNEISTLKTRQFTTIKVPAPSYWWVWLIVALGILLIGGTIFLIIYIRKKKQGVW